MHGCFDHLGGAAERVVAELRRRRERSGGILILVLQPHHRLESGRLFRIEGAGPVPVLEEIVEVAIAAEAIAAEAGEQDVARVEQHSVFAERHDVVERRGRRQHRFALDAVDERGQALAPEAFAVIALVDVDEERLLFPHQHPAGA